MGSDSIDILIRLLKGGYLTPAVIRDQFVVISAQPGGESQLTKTYNERHVLPLLREHGIRYIQVARRGRSFTDGYTVLDDSRCPTQLYSTPTAEKPFFTLYQEMLENGTVPQFASGKRVCSDKFKGQPIHWLLKDMFGMQPIIQIFGYSADEPKRIAKALLHEPSRGLNNTFVFPLDQWGVDRIAVAANTDITFGEPAPRSCCGFCPFAESSGGTNEMIVRWRQFPDECLATLQLEHVSVALNPRATLYPGERRALTVVQKAHAADPQGLAQALADYTAWLTTTTWAVYSVQRVYHKVGTTDRRLTTLATGSRAAMTAAVATHGDVEHHANDAVTPRVYLRRREASYPSTEEMIVAAPALANDKSRTRFAKSWSHATEQLPLF